MLHAYERGLDLGAALAADHAVVFFATSAFRSTCFVLIPKGFLPQQDNGLITATSEAAQDISFADMKRHQKELSKIVMADPDVATVRWRSAAAGGPHNGTCSSR